MSTFAQISYEEIKDFRFAYSLFEDGMYQLSFSEFQKFIKKYPESKLIEEAHFFSAESIFKLGEYDSALKLYLLLLSEVPSTRFKDKANYRVAEIYLNNKDYKEAIKRFKFAIEASSDKLLISRSAYYLSKIYSEQNDLKNALKYCTLSYEVDTTGEVAPFAIFLSALVYQKQNKFQEAIEKYESLIRGFEREQKLNELLNKARINLIDCYYKTKNYSRVVEIARDFFSREFVDEKVLFMLAESYYALDLLDSAKFYYEEYLNRFPSGELVKNSAYSIAWIYYKRGDYEKAVQIFDSLSSGADDISELSLFYLGEVKKASGDTSGAVLAFKNFAEKSRKYPELKTRANYEIGFLYFVKGEYDSSIAYFEKIPLDDTSDVRIRAFELLAQSYIRRGNYSKGASILRMIRKELSLTPEREAVNIYSEGIALMNEGKFSESIKAFEEYISKFPNDLKVEWALLYLGEMYYKTGDYKNSRKYYMKILNQFPQSPNVEQAFYSIAWSYFKEGNYNEALRKFDEFLKKYSSGDRALDARLRLADCYFALKNYKSAESHYLSYVRLFGDREGADYAYFQLSQVYLRQNQLMRSLEMLNLLLNKFPNSSLAPTALYQIGWIYFRDKNYTPAINSFKDLLDKYPQSELAPRALYGIGDAYYNLGNYGLAIKTYLELIERYPASKYAEDAFLGIQYCLTAQGKNPNLADSLILKSKHPNFIEVVALKKAEFQISQGNYSEGINLYKRFIASYQDSSLLPRVYYELGRVYEIIGRNFEAEEIYKTLISRYPLSEFAQSALLRLGWIKFNLSKHAEATEYLSGIQTTVKFYDEVLYLIGLNYLSIGDTTKAMEELKRLLSDFPHSDFSDRARVKLGEIFLGLGKILEALEILRPTVLNRAIDEVSAQSQYLYAEAYFRLGELDEAILQFLRVKYLYGDYVEFLPMAYYRLSECYEIKGDSNKAIQFLNDILKMNISDEMRSQVLEKLERLKTKS